MALIKPEVWYPHVAAELVLSENIIGPALTTSGEINLSNANERGKLYHFPFFDSLLTMGAMENVESTTTLTNKDLSGSEEIANIMTTGYSFIIKGYDKARVMSDPLAFFKPQVLPMLLETFQLYMESVIKGCFGTELVDGVHVVDKSGDQPTPALFESALEEAFGEQYSKFNKVIFNSKVEAYLKGKFFNYFGTMNQIGMDMFRTGLMPVFNGKQVFKNNTIATISNGVAATYFCIDQPFSLSYNGGTLESTRVPKYAGGSDEYIFNANVVPHLKGMKWNNSTPATTFALLEDATKWTKAFPDKLIKIVKVLHAEPTTE